MPYVAPEVVQRVKQIDLLTYLKNYEPYELVHFSGNTYSTRTHDSLKISNGKWMWWSRGIGGRSALDYLIKVRGYDFVQAVQMIAEQAAIQPPVSIPAEKKIREMEEEAVRQALSEQAQGPGIEIEKLRLNFDTLLKTLSVSVSDLARFLSYDPSYLSRIRKGQRKLSDPQKFTADAFLKLDAKTEGTRRSILSSLPLYTADDELVFQVLRDNRVSEKNQIRIMEHIAFQRELTEEILSHDSIFEAYPNFSKDEFAQYPMTLSLAGAFYEEDIVYTYEQYREHLEMMKRFSQMHKNYHIEENKSPAFRHIQILIHEGSWAIVSKEKTPAIHFVIRHPKMREAMENITMPIVEGEEYK